MAHRIATPAKRERGTIESTGLTDVAGCANLGGISVATAGGPQPRGRPFGDC